MTNVALEQLLSEEFVQSLGTHSTAESLRRCLFRSRTVRELKDALSAGKITEPRIRSFVRRILKDFRQGESFPYEYALAAIAVMLETRHSPLAEEYLIDLARTRVTELAMCRRVAGLCAQAWARLPKTTKISSPRKTSFTNRIENEWRMTIVLHTKGLADPNSTIRIPGRLTNADA